MALAWMEEEEGSRKREREEEVEHLCCLFSCGHLLFRGRKYCLPKVSE